MDRDDRMFWFDLAWRLGYSSPSELAGNLAESQLHEWKTWLEANR